MSLAATRFGRSWIQLVALDKRRRWAAYVGLILCAMWWADVRLAWETSGLFRWLGIDYGIFWAGAQAFLSDGPLAVYDLHTIASHIRPLGAYYGPGAGPLQVGPVPYPPAFVLLLTPFTLLPPSTGFLLWTLINLLLAVPVVRGLAARSRHHSWLLTAMGLAFFPLGYALWVGQPTVILLFALYRAYRAFEQGQELRAGLWTGALLLKPQYALVLILVLLFKRRWRALSGVGLVGLGFLLSSLALLGPGGLLTYVSSLRYASGFRAVLPIVYPEHMMNWRGLLVNVLPPSVSEADGFALTVLLSAATLSTLLVIWRGQWDPRDERFAARFLATIIVTMLTSFHNHVHGGALLLVPMLALAAQEGPRAVQVLLRVSLCAPLIVFHGTYAFEYVAWSCIGLMLFALGAIVVAELRPSLAGMSRKPVALSDFHGPERAQARA